MAKQIIVNGESVGSGWTKTNENFTELYNRTEQVGVSGYVEDATMDTAPVVDTYIPVSVPFTNVYSHNFEEVVGQNKIKYIGLQTLEVNILTSISLSVGSNAVLVTFAIYKNGTYVDGSKMPREFDINSTGSMSGICSVELSTNDDIQIVVKADKANEPLNDLDIHTLLQRAF